MFALNRHLTEEMELDVLARGFDGLGPERATTLHDDDLAAVNTRAAPDRARPRQLSGISVDGERIRAKLPPASWNVLRFA